MEIWFFSVNFDSITQFTSIEPKAMKYDIFISYKRLGVSSATAAVLYQMLQQKGYNVFFDRKEMRSGKFNEQLLEHIGNATDVIILLEEASLGSWFNYRPRPRKENVLVGEGDSFGDNDSMDASDLDSGIKEEPYKSDWFCKEVMYSLTLKGKNIIPILLGGYHMPEGKDLIWSGKAIFILNPRICPCLCVSRAKAESSGATSSTRRRPLVMSMSVENR